MSKAIRCDRCKKCFDPYKVDGDFARITDFVVTDAKIFDSHECSYRDENIDLCPDCLKSWNRWLKNYSDTITTVDNYYNDIVVDKESLDEAMFIDKLRK